jgi:putative peptidoglycan lipid II flippase
MGGVFSAGFPALLATGKIGLSGEAMRKAVGMAWPMGLVLPMGLNISLFSAWMMAGSRHRNTLLEALPALLIMIALFLPSAWITEPLVFGTVAGFLLQMVALAFPLQRSGDLPRPGFGFRSEVWSGFWQSIGILSIGQLMTSFTNVIDQFYAAGLDTGSLSTLSYANRVLSLLFSMGAMAISRATLPIFSEVHAQQDSVVKKIALRWSTLMFFIGTGVMIAGILGGPLIIRTLFERGAFTSENTMFVADVFRNSLFQVPFYFAGLVLVSALASTKQYRKIAFVGAFNLVSKMLFAYLLVGSLHLNGLVVSTALMYLVSMILLYVFVRF